MVKSLLLEAAEAFNCSLFEAELEVKSILLGLG